MKAETFFLFALVFAVVALLCLWMRANPFFMAVNTDDFPIFYVWPSGPTIEMEYAALSFIIFLPCAYFSIAFCIGGIAKLWFEKVLERKG